MAETVIHTANLQDVTINGANINELRIFGMRIHELIETELNRQDPERVKLRMKNKYDLDEIKRMIASLDKIRTAFTQKLRSHTPETLNNHPEPDRWSALEHVRHLVFAEDLYLNRWILHGDKTWNMLGFFPPFLLTILRMLMWGLNPRRTW